MMVPDRAHVLHCEKDDCVVCDHRLAELREQWESAYFYVKYFTAFDQE